MNKIIKVIPPRLCRPRIDTYLHLPGYEFHINKPVPEPDYVLTQDSKNLYLAKENKVYTVQQVDNPECKRLLNYGELYFTPKKTTIIFNTKNSIFKNWLIDDDAYEVYFGYKPNTISNPYICINEDDEELYIKIIDSNLVNSCCKKNYSILHIRYYHSRYKTHHLNWECILRKIDEGLYIFGDDSIFTIFPCRVLDVEQKFFESNRSYYKSLAQKIESVAREHKEIYRIFVRLLNRYMIENTDKR
jgi:hypothetical protein